MSEQKMVDIAVIGGGINGCGIARDAAGRGLTVLLAEQNDLSSGTSSASTKLIHGGLRYLEHFEFRLVRESLQEREVLMGMAPHLIHPLRFVLPHHKELRPPWLIRLGLFLYDHLGKRTLLPPSRQVSLKRTEVGSPLKPGFTKGFEYSDCWVDDARLVVVTAMDAAARGADIRVHTEMRSARREGGRWKVELLDKRTGNTEVIEAKVLVNATGPWISQVISQRFRMESALKTRLVQGSHIVVPRIFSHDRAYIFQNADRRIIFAIPYNEDFTLIGTTDVDYQGDPGAAAISKDEIQYLCEAASEYFSVPIRPGEVTWTYSGIRPLYGEAGTAAQEATRDYILDLQGGADSNQGGVDAAQGGAEEAPLLNVFGGKITTYRCLAEEALKLLKERIPGLGPAWTRGVPLPGGDFPTDKMGGMGGLLAGLASEFPAFPPALIHRMAHAYGTRTRDLLAGVENPDQMGHHFGTGLYEREVVYLIEHEWAASAADILWRRSKLGLRMSSEEVRGLDEWLQKHYPALTVPTDSTASVASVDSVAR